MMQHFGRLKRRCADKVVTRLACINDCLAEFSLLVYLSFEIRYEHQWNNLGYLTMKKITVVLIAMVFLAALVRSFASSSSPSTLEVNVLLAEGGVNMIPQPRTYVGFVPDRRFEEPTLGNITVIQPNEGTENVYKVPPNRRIGIFVLSRGVPPFQSTVIVEPRQHKTHDVILDAGIVQVTTDQTANAMNSNIWFLDSDGQFDANYRFVDGVEFMVPAGEQVFQFGRYLEAKRELIDVIAGQTQNLNITSEIGSLTIDIQTDIPFQELSPTPILRAERGSKRLHARGGEFDAGRWQFGSYDVTFQLGERFNYPIRPATIGPLTVTIDQLENSMTIPVSLVGVDVRFTEWDEKMPEYATALVVSTDDPGLPFATYRVTDGRAPLIFMPPEETHDYAIALVANNEVLALQAVGFLPANSPYEALVVPGGNADLCEAIVLDFDCSPLSQ
jgi:hypothetical protein